MADFDTFASSLRSEFGEQGAGKKFEVFCKWFLQNDPQWSAIVEEVWLWDEYPDKWQRQELGTDLVFRDKDGDIWAVQVKFFGEHRATIKGDVDSFFADSGRAIVKKRLWLQSTNKMQSTARTMLMGQEKPTIVFNLNDFRNSKLNYPSNFRELHQVQPIEKPLPDKHQEEAIDAVVAGLKKYDRGQLIMACGTGKTFTTLWIKEAMKAESTLVLLPSLNLLSQTMREWAWGAKDKFQILNVCSDQSVGRLPEDMATSELSFPVTSDVLEIIDFLSKPGRKVLFSTYQSSPLIAAAHAEKLSTVFDLAVADEAHRCAGSVEAAFSKILDEDKIRANKRLFTTATPRYFGKNLKAAAKLRDLEVVGMDDEAVFGPIIHKLTFGEAIQRNLLNDYQVVIVGVDEPSVAELINNSELISVTPDNQTDARTLAAKLGLLKAIKDHDLRRLISFHGRVKGAQKFADEFCDVANLLKPSERPKGEFYTDYVSGVMKTGERQDKIHQLKTLDGYDRGIMANARCLAEGVDVPSLDGIAFIDPRGSQIEIIQAVGRAIRKVRNAKVQVKGTIVIPVFIEHGDDQEASIEASNFKPVWDVLKALRAHDEVLADVLDNYRADLAVNDHAADNDIEKVVFDLPIVIDKGFSNALKTMIVEHSTSSWEYWFALLEQYYYDHDDVNVAHGWETPNGDKLGNWVTRQRKYRNTLSADRFERLNALGFYWDYHNDVWNFKFSKLVEYKNENGDCLVEPDFVTPDGIKLGDWVRSQRNQENLSEIRIELLNSIGFSWDNLYEVAWEKGFSYLLDFQETNGHLRIKSNHVSEDGYPLGSWATTQRTNNDLDEEKTARLVEIGFIFDTDQERWERHYEALVEFKKEHSHCLVSSRHKTSCGLKLGGWVQKQKYLYSKERLPKDKIELLEELGFAWSHTLELFNLGLEALKAVFSKNQHCRVPRNHGLQTLDGRDLYDWVRATRAQKEVLTENQIEQLELLGFPWDALLDRWERKFVQYKDFVTQHKSIVPPKEQKFEDGSKMRNWFDLQRKNKDSLIVSQINRLNDLGYKWSKEDQKWEVGFLNLLTFQKQNGHCSVPIDVVLENGYQLGIWVDWLRHNKNSLYSSSVERLDELGFDWAK